jgi:hypothetical protein
MCGESVCVVYCRTILRMLTELGPLPLPICSVVDAFVNPCLFSFFVMSDAAVQALTAALKVGTTKSTSFLQPIAAFLVENAVDSVEDLGGVDVLKLARGTCPGEVQMAWLRRYPVDALHQWLCMRGTTLLFQADRGHGGSRLQE